MNENIKPEVLIYIRNNCKRYRNYFYLKNTNDVMNHVVKILEKKFLHINTFCYYVNYCITDMIKNCYFYLNLSKIEKKQLEFYNVSLVKIYMHINCIFVELDNIKKYLKKQK